MTSYDRQEQGRHWTHFELRGKNVTAQHEFRAGTLGQSRRLTTPATVVAGYVYPRDYGFDAFVWTSSRTRYGNPCQTAYPLGTYTTSEAAVAAIGKTFRWRQTFREDARRRYG